ncbi:hypothetical protein [Lentzea sp. NBRC 102530]|uniref:hypothetical protein n=1 Tax=Lentzea sp. NBRC 102530 TaxID=3032201 RepID=UPI00249FA4F0|nr:hypothetical protein [Lentzea sp. NBRC 102530]GLY55327.1 hypothetical protein Lesp01_89820 [Lentzea sp. NBRC 102530]
MSDDFLTDPGQDADGSALRKFGTAQQKRADALEAQLKELQSQLAARSRKDVLDELKVPEGIRKFYTGEATSDAVKAWIEENKTVFNFGAQDAPADDAAPSSQDGNGSQIPAEIVAQQQRLQAAADAARDNAGSVGFDGFKAAAAQLMSSGSRPSEADLDKFLGQYLGAGSLDVPRQI